MPASGDRRKFVVSWEVGYLINDGWTKMLAQWNLDHRRVPEPFRMAEQTESQELSERQPIEVRLDQAADFASFARYCDTFETEEPEARSGAKRLARRVCEWAELPRIERWERILATRYLNDDHRMVADGRHLDIVKMHRENGYHIGGWCGPSDESLAIAGIRQAPEANRERRSAMRDRGRYLSSNAKALIVFAACMCGVALLVWALMP
jgi:hypothetical protein